MAALAKAHQSRDETEAKAFALEETPGPAFALAQGTSLFPLVSGVRAGA